ncbi:MAG: membrane protein [Ktedonobacteraceae bacterium]
MHLESLRPLLSRAYMLRLIVVIFGLFLFATGTVFIYRSNLGLDPWDVLHQGISLHTPLSFGTASIVVGGIIIVLSLLLRVYPGVATVLNMVLIGLFVDLELHLGWLANVGTASLPVRLLVNVVGVAIVGLGSAFYIAPRLGTGPRDGLMMRLHTLTKVRIAIVRATIECSVLLAGFLLGGSIGIGTLIFAFGIGPAVEISFKLAKKCHLAELLHVPPIQPAVKQENLAVPTKVSVPASPHESV